jgi:hypothetical protein
VLELRSGSGSFLWVEATTLSAEAAGFEHRSFIHTYAIWSPAASIFMGSGGAWQSLAA